MQLHSQLINMSPSYTFWGWYLGLWRPKREVLCLKHWLIWLAHHLLQTKQLYFNKDLRLKVWCFIIIIRLINQIWRYIKRFIMSSIDSLDLFAVLRKTTVFFKFFTMSTMLKLVEIKTLKVISKRIIRDKLVTIKVKVAIGVKGWLQIPSSKESLPVLNSVSKIIQDQVVLWWHITSEEMIDIGHRRIMCITAFQTWPKHDQQLHLGIFCPSWSFRSRT